MNTGNFELDELIKLADSLETSKEIILAIVNLYDCEDIEGICEIWENPLCAELILITAFTYLKDVICLDWGDSTYYACEYEQFLEIESKVSDLKSFKALGFYAQQRTKFGGNVSYDDFEQWLQLYNYENQF